MRLTPSRLRSSSGSTPDDHSTGPDASPEVTIYRAPTATVAGTGSGSTIDPVEFVQSSDAEVLAVLDEVNTPATVDEVTDRLVRPKRPGLETWAAVHEHLHEERLPALDAEGVVEFDAAQGVVDLPEESGRGRNLLRTAFAAVLVGILFVLLVVLSTSSVTAPPL